MYLIVVDFEQLYVYIGEEKGSGVDLQILIQVLLNFINIIHPTPKFLCHIAERPSLGVNIPLFSPIRWPEKYWSIWMFKANFKLILLTPASLMEEASSETRAKFFPCELFSKSMV